MHKRAELFDHPCVCKSIGANLKMIRAYDRVIADLEKDIFIALSIMILWLTRYYKQFQEWAK